ncbi:hypothetical protein C4571_02075 [Candidatus Parcubacteria bacterium]|nr:MAG: hypothetical protein C4571_02075 [Candidatus Parcubacteria bacterium]
MTPEERKRFEEIRREVYKLYHPEDGGRYFYDADGNPEYEEPEKGEPTIRDDMKFLFTLLDRLSPAAPAPQSAEQRRCCDCHFAVIDANSFYCEKSGAFVDDDPCTTFCENWQANVTPLTVTEETKEPQTAEEVRKRLEGMGYAVAHYMDYQKKPHMMQAADMQITHEIFYRGIGSTPDEAARNLWTAVKGEKCHIQKP